MDTIGTTAQLGRYRHLPRKGDWPLVSSTASLGTTRGASELSVVTTCRRLISFVLPHVVESVSSSSGEMRSAVEFWNRRRGLGAWGCIRSLSVGRAVRLVECVMDHIIHPASYVGNVLFSSRDVVFHTADGSA